MRIIERNPVIRLDQIGIAEAIRYMEQLTMTADSAVRAFLFDARTDSGISVNVFLARDHHHRVVGAGALTWRSFEAPVCTHAYVLPAFRGAGLGSTITKLLLDVANPRHPRKTAF